MKRTLAILTAAALIVAALVRPVTRANSLLLDATTKSLELETSSAAQIDYVVSYADHTATTFVPGMNQGTVSSATTTAILAAPAASTQRQVKWITVRNRSTTTAQTATLKLDVSATEYHLGAATTLGPGEYMRMNANGETQVYTSAGLLRSMQNDIAGFSGRSSVMVKAGTAKDAVGYYQAQAKDAGQPGAYVLGTPGLNGATFDCSSGAGATVAGANILPDAGTGAYYMTAANIVGGNSEAIHLVDVLWYNTGLSVTTTTGQAVTFSGLPARDVDGSTNGEGVQAALYVSAATTNAGVITNTTLTYTDQDGNAGNTAAMFPVVGYQAPATAVIGTWIPFFLAAGDRGIRSVQTITLGTSYVTGSLSLVLYRPIMVLPNLAAIGSLGHGQQFFSAPGIRLYNDTCIWALTVGSANAAIISGTYTIIERP